MSDLISREQAISAIESHIRTVEEPYQLKEKDRIVNYAFEVAISCLLNLPSADPKTGKWIQAKGVEIEYAVCTNCTHHGEFYMRYCPNCGAKMCKGGDTE